MPLPRGHSAPAFPNSVSADPHGGLNYSDDPGLTFRDYFAAAALSAVVAARTTLSVAGIDHDINQESIAEECYELADAMLEERAKKRTE